MYLCKHHTVPLLDAAGIHTLKGIVNHYGSLGILDHKSQYSNNLFLNLFITILNISTFIKLEFVIQFIINKCTQYMPC